MTEKPFLQVFFPAEKIDANKLEELRKLGGRGFEIIWIEDNGSDKPKGKPGPKKKSSAELNAISEAEIEEHQEGESQK